MLLASCVNPHICIQPQNRPIEREQDQYVEEPVRSVCDGKVRPTRGRSRYWGTSDPLDSRWGLGKLVGITTAPSNRWETTPNRSALDPEPPDIVEVNPGTASDLATNGQAHSRCPGAGGWPQPSGGDHRTETQSTAIDAVVGPSPTLIDEDLTVHPHPRIDGVIGVRIADVCPRVDRTRAVENTGAFRCPTLHRRSVVCLGPSHVTASASSRTFVSDLLLSASGWVWPLPQAHHEDRLSIGSAPIVSGSRLRWGGTVAWTDANEEPDRGAGRPVRRGSWSVSSDRLRSSFICS